MDWLPLLLIAAYILTAVVARRRLIQMLADDMETDGPLNDDDYSFIRIWTVAVAAMWPLFWWPIRLIHFDSPQNVRRPRRNREVVERIRNKRDES